MSEREREREGAEDMSTRLTQVTESLNKIMAQLDQLTLNQSTGELRNPVIQRVLAQTRAVGNVVAAAHTSYFSHLSHYSSAF
jgi:uncharacterized membrane protein YoaK (UPF0700 family)